MVDEHRIRDLATEYVERWVSDDPTLGYEAEHIDGITERVVGYLSGRGERPWLHAHSATELGMCIECDAANVLAEYECLDAMSPRARTFFEGAMKAYEDAPKGERDLPRDL